MIVIFFFGLFFFDIKAENIGMVNKPAPFFELYDYNNLYFNFTQANKNILVLLFGGRKNGPDQAGIKTVLDQQYKNNSNLKIVSIGIVKAPPFIPKSLIKAGFRKETKGVQTFCDWGGKVARLFGAEDKGITVVLINKNGIIKYIKRNFNKSELNELLKELENVKGVN